MAHVGEYIENPITGERLTFLATAQETEGRLLRMDFVVPPHKISLPLHVHTLTEERCEVRAGALGLQVGTTTRRLGPGEAVVAPAGVRHRWWNAGEEDVHFLCEARPPRRTQQALEAAFGLARDGRCTRKGVPKNIFEAALVFQLAEAYIVAPPLPIGVQKALFGALAAVARRLGYPPAFPQYTRAGGARSRTRTRPAWPGACCVSPWCWRPAVRASSTTRELAWALNDATANRAELGTGALQGWPHHGVLSTREGDVETGEEWTRDRVVRSDVWAWK